MDCIVKKPLLLKIYEAASMQRWNDQIRMVELTELDKQAHKMIAAYVLGKFEESSGNRQINWTSIIEAGLFEFLHHADAVAALAVAMIVVLVSIRLGMRTIRALLDTAPKGLKEKVTREVESIEGVADCHNVRIRHSGAKIFLDIHILVDGGKSLKEVHDLTEKIENKIENIIPDVDVTVHPEPQAFN